MYKVEYFTYPNGKSPIVEFILSSQKSLRSKIERQIDSLKEFGLTINNPYLKKLTGTTLWESRILGKDNTRIISVASIGNRIVILNIFRKKSQKTPLKEIKISLKRYRELTSDI